MKSRPYRWPTSGTDLHRPAFRRALTAWLHQNQSRFQCQPYFVKKGGRKAELKFHGLAKEITWVISYGRSSESKIFIHLRDGSYFDIMQSHYAAAKRTAARQYQCPFCQELETFETTEDLWADHLFTPILDFVNSLSESTIIGLYGTPERGFWGARALKDPKELQFDDDFYTAGFAPVLTGVNVKVADEELRYVIAGGSILAKSFPKHMKAQDRRREEADQNGR